MIYSDMWRKGGCQKGWKDHHQGRRQIDIYISDIRRNMLYRYMMMRDDIYEGWNEWWMVRESDDDIYRQIGRKLEDNKKILW